MTNIRYGLMMWEIKYGKYNATNVTWEMLLWENLSNYSYPPKDAPFYNVEYRNCDMGNILWKI